MMNRSIQFAPKELADALAAIKPACSTRSCVTALAGVLIRDRGGEAVTVAATDMSVAAQRTLFGYGGDGRFIALVNHAELSKAVKLFAKRPSVTLTRSSNLAERYRQLRSCEGVTASDAIRQARESERVDVTVGDGQREITLPGLRMADFPPLDFTIGEPLLTAEPRELASVLERALLFASKDDKRPILTGVRFDLEREPTIAATDSYRLGLFALPGYVHQLAAATIDGFALRVALKSIKTSLRDVTIRLAERAATIQTDECMWSVRLIDGQYPNYAQLWPDYAHEANTGYGPGADYHVRVPVDELREACETAVQFLHKNAPMRIQLNGGVDITGRTPDGPSFREKIPNAGFVRHAGPDLEYGVNPEFMRDIAKVANNGTLDCLLLSPLRPVAFLDGEDRYLLMPIRLNV